MNVGKLLILIGFLFLGIGGLIYLAAKIGITNGRLPLGRLPGDFYFKGENFSCMIPLATSLLLSIILTLVINILIKIINR